MTAHKNFKQLVRTRMAKTGESYTTARRQVLADAPPQPSTGPTAHHLPGSIPATTALRVLLTAAGIRDPRTKKPFTEAMLFVISGGVGAGMAAFYYKQADISTFYIAGRHAWHSDQEYLTASLSRFGIKPTFRESAAKHLADALATGSPCIAWVDMTHLPHRAMPMQFSGGGYHVITIYSIDESRNVALIGDLADEPIEISLDDLATARARIKQFKKRLLTIEPASAKIDPSSLITDGLKACHEGLKSGRGKGPLAMSGLGVFQKWAKQLQATTGKESWAEMFPRGHRLWTALSFAHEYIDHANTGGALCRAIFAAGLAEAAEVSGQASLRGLSVQYANLATMWSDLADTLLPQNVPAFKQLKGFCSRRAELRADADEQSAGELPALSKRIFEMREKSKNDFPLTESECVDLRAKLHVKVAAIYEAESAAHSAMGKILA